MNATDKAIADLKTLNIAAGEQMPDVPYRDEVGMLYERAWKNLMGMDFRQATMPAANGEGHCGAV